MICIGCGCDDSHACTLPGGRPCAWIHAGAQGLAGICSACVEMYPLSIRDAEVEIAESAIAEAMVDYGDIGPVPGIMAQAEARVRYIEPRTESALDTLRRAFDETPRLILPGDEEFHL